MGISECVATDLQHYAETAVRLGKNRDLRMRVECLIRERCGLLLMPPSLPYELSDVFQNCLFERRSQYLDF
ncbi:MAG: hypothetical protein HW406_2640 [Candidatus Brocadiaceae bacterium]|nr:hypothetical protein [Candidatus Brocadiaceae bacterium]MBM2835479.1 hypothetical protein [Candidatus Brocadiaceae bacterium]